MRRVRLVGLLLALFSLVNVATIVPASASDGPTPPISQPRITAVTSTAVCNIYPCMVNATLTYNEQVGFTADAYRAFTVTDLSQPSIAPCVTLSLGPSPVVGIGNQLVLHVSCLVHQGDRMHLGYVAFLPPTPIPGYVYSLAPPHVPALSPQLFDWIEGPTLCCPPSTT